MSETATAGRKPSPSPIQDAQAATDLLTSLGYTGISDVIKHGRTWHALALPPGGTVEVEVSIDPNGRVHYDDVTTG